MKKKRPLRRVSIAPPPAAEEAMVDLMERVFERSAVIYTNEETRKSTVSIFCERDSKWNSAKRAELAKGIVAIKAAGLEVGAGTISVAKVAREDWAESWKRHFRAIEIGSRLLVKPGWVKRRARKGQATVVLDPGLSFGTGNHPTTAFCLRALVDSRTDDKRQSFLDLGTGSGILAIAAAKLGYAPVVAMDFDSEAVRVAKENARRNRVRIKIRRADLTQLPCNSNARYQLICANLISNLLLVEKRRILGRLAPGGVLVLAGILKKEFAEMQRAYEKSGLRLLKSKSEKEWQSGVFVSSA